jgi:hypothetical protein
VAVAGGGHGAFGELAAHLVDGDQRVGALVGIHPDHDHPDHACSSHRPSTAGFLSLLWPGGGGRP